MINTNLPAHVVAFAGQDNTKIYTQFKDYYFHYMKENANKELGSYDSAITLAEKDSRMHASLMSEIQRVYGSAIPSGISYEQFSSNPNFIWATFAVVNNMIDAIIPDTIIKSIGVYTDLRTIPMGGTAQFDIAPNSIMTISDGSNSRRTTWAQKEFKTSHTIVPINHTFTVEVSMYKVLAGEASLAEFVRKAVISMETKMTVDAYGALTALVDSVSFPTALKPAGYSVEDLLDLCQTVEAYNRSTPVIVGTAKALYKILPDASAGYRINTPSEAQSIQILRNFFKYDIMEIPQVATGGADYGLALRDNEIYVISTGVDKIIKGVIEGGMYTVNRDFTDNANLTASQTMNKRYTFEAVSNAKIGCMTLA